MNSIDPTLLDIPEHKFIDGPWIGLLVLAIFIFVASIIAIIVLCLLWRRYRRLTQYDNKSYILSNQPTGKRQIPIQIDDQQPKSYETQRINAFVPPQDDIQRVHQFYERTTKAYF